MGYSPVYYGILLGFVLIHVTNKGSVSLPEALHASSHQVLTCEEEMSETWRHLGNRNVPAVHNTSAFLTCFFFSA